MSKDFQPWGGPQTLTRLRTDAENKTVFPIRVRKDPHGKLFANYRDIRLRLPVPFTMVLPGVDIIGKEIPMIVKRFTRKIHGTVREREFFMFFPADCKSLPKEFWDLDTVRSFKAIMKVSPNREPYLDYRGIRCVLADREVWDSYGWERCIGNEILVTGYVGVTRVLVLPKYNDLDAKEDLTRIPTSSISDSLKGIMTINDASGYKIKVPACFILGIKPESPVDAANIKKIAQDLKIQANNTETTPIEWNGLFFSDKKSLQMAIIEARDIVIHMVESGRKYLIGAVDRTDVKVGIEDNEPIEAFEETGNGYTDNLLSTEGLAKETINAIEQITEAIEETNSSSISPRICATCGEELSKDRKTFCNNTCRNDFKKKS